MTSTKKTSNKLIAVLAFLTTIRVKILFFVHEEYLDYYLDKPVIVLCFGFVSLVLIGWLGVISVSQNYLNGIITFSVLLFGEFLLVITLAGVGATTINFAAAATYKALEEHMSNYTYNAASVNLLQSDLSCCGINGSDDWITLLGSIPGSCCNSNSTCEATHVNFPGCYTTLTSLMNNFIWLLFTVLIVLGIIKITIMALSYILIRKLQNSDKDATTDLTNNRTEIPRVQNPLARIHKPEEEPKENAKNNSIARNDQSPRNTYVRHSTQRPIMLNYRSRHENYLNAPAQLRFDRRYILQHSKALEHPRKIYV
ncbi:tetraspanin-9 isoform X2 [Cephus cinctus]|uniref:Tetraspanin-9 isoform X2 n=1 Tax=Cephus cinctus TaxID=211228 RepID=A0AAJ7RHL6_CEPCN|nr:tetraspanin-9 isoform X2 [Cephus cinctus]